MKVIDNGYFTVVWYEILIFRGKASLKTGNTIQFVFIGYAQISVEVQDERIDQNIRPNALF